MEKIRCILLPGLDGSGQFFDAFAAEIARFADPVVVRYPDVHGLSYDDLADYVAATLSVDQAYFIVAESFSGPVAISIAARHPGQLKCLVLVATFARSPFPRVGAVLAALLPVLARFPLPQWLIRLVLLNGRRPEVACDIQDVIRTVPKHVLASRLRNVLTCDVTGLLRKIDVPVMAIRADRDRLLPGKCSNEMSEFQSAIRIVGIDAPHFVLQIEPEVTAAKLVEPFLRECIQES